MSDIGTWCIILWMGAMVGFAVGYGIGHTQGRSDGIEAERRWLDRRSKLSTHERK